MPLFRRLFSRNPGLVRGALPARLKHYASPTGHHYEYCSEGYRPYLSRTDSGTEFVFRISAHKTGPTVAVFLSAAVLREWELCHGREFSQAERYAIAKMALFQAFDECAGPGEMRANVHVRPADLEAIVATLNID
jgi:hypothetical protein